MRALIRPRLSAGAACILVLALGVSAAPGAQAQGGQRGVSLAAPRATGGLPAGAPIYGRSHAVVIGVDAYRSLPRLKGAVRDARSVAAALRQRGFSVEELINRKATASSIRAVLGDRMPARIAANDRVLVFFAGHGVSTGEEGSEMGYLMPVEGDRRSPRATGVAMSELQSWFAGYRAKHVMFVADACYSGLALSTRSVGLPPGAEAYLREVTSRPVRMAMVAGRADEEAHEWRGQGLFTRFFLEAMSGAADANGDGLVTGDELTAYVKPQVATTARSQLGASQHPQTGRSGAGEFVFLSQAGPAPSAPAAPAPAPAPAVAVAAPTRATSPPAPARTAATPRPRPSKLARRPRTKKPAPDKDPMGPYLDLLAAGTAHFGLADQWGDTPLSLDVLVGGGWWIHPKLAPFARVGLLGAAKVDDDRIGFETQGSTERFRRLTVRAGVKAGLLSVGRLRVQGVAEGGFALVRQELLFRQKIAATRSDIAIGAGAGVMAALFGGRKGSWTLHLMWWLLPMDLPTTSAFRTKGGTDLGGLEVAFGSTYGALGP